jgi:GNAT superfamily N-acetyltransferase
MISPINLGEVQAMPCDGFDDLLCQSREEGYGMLERLIVEYRSGANRFSRPGEILLAACVGERLVGLCGRNVDPYLSDPKIGRVRHLYVARDARRCGVGRLLVGAIIQGARGHFRLLTLRADDPQAAAFYRTLGFREWTEGTTATHWIALAETPTR